MVFTDGPSASQKFCPLDRDQMMGDYLGGHSGSRASRYRVAFLMYPGGLEYKTPGLGASHPLMGPYNAPIPLKYIVGLNDTISHYLISPLRLFFAMPLFPRGII